MKRFEQTVIDQPKAEPPPGVGSITRDVPTRAPEVSGDVLVPLLRALVSGGCLFIVAAILVAVGVLIWAWAWWVPLLGGVVVAALTMAVVWFWKGLTDKLLWATETITGQDLNRDGRIGSKELFTIEDIQRTPSGSQWEIFDLPGGPERFASFAMAALSHGSLSEVKWSGKDRPYRKPDYLDLRDELIDRGWFRWVNPDHHPSGWELTDKGKRKLAQWLEQYHHSRARLIESPDDGIGGWE